MGLPRQEYRSGLPFPSPGVFLTQGSNPYLLYWQVDSLPLSHQGSPRQLLTHFHVFHHQPHSPGHIPDGFLSSSLASISSLQNSLLAAILSVTSFLTPPVVELLLGIDNAVLPWWVGLQQLFCDVIDGSNSRSKCVHLRLQGLKPDGWKSWR